MKKVLVLVLMLFAGNEFFGQNQNISNGYIFDGEPYLVVNPENPRHMVVAWMGYSLFSNFRIKTKVTFDGGQTWSSSNFIPHTHPLYESVDPSMAFDKSGNVFLSFIDFNENQAAGAVYLVESTDGGVTWGDAHEVISVNSDVQKPVDRPWINIDTSDGPNGGNIYITTIPPTVFGYLPPPYHPYLSVSKDGGNSFQWRYLDTANWLAGNVIVQPMATGCIASNGMFYAVYPSYVFTQNSLPQFIVASSDDGGNSFSRHSLCIDSATVSNDLVKKGYLILSDPTDTAHLVFANLEEIYGDIDVFVRDSYDAGVNWSNPVRVNDDPLSNNRIQDLLWGDFDFDGDLLIAWRDRRNGADSSYSTSYEIWGAYRKKDSLVFDSNFRISDTLIAYDSVLAYSGNDFMCVRLANDTLSAVWGDTRNGSLNIWFQRMPVNGNMTVIKKINSDDFPDVRVFPNPVYSSVTILGVKVKSVSVYTESGKMVGKYYNQKTIDLNRLPAGKYVLKIVTGKGTVTKKILKTD